MDSTFFKSEAIVFTDSLVWKRNGYSDNIIFANAIILDQELNKGEQCFIYRIKQQKKKEHFDTFNNISECENLVQPMYTVGSLNNSVGTTGNCIFD